MSVVAIDNHGYAVNSSGGNERMRMGSLKSRSTKGARINTSRTSGENKLIDKA